MFVEVGSGSTPAGSLGRARGKREMEVGKLMRISLNLSNPNFQLLLQVCLWAVYQGPFSLSFTSYLHLFFFFYQEWYSFQLLWR